MADQEMPRVKTYVAADGRRLRFQAKDEDGVVYDLSDIRDNGSATFSACLGDVETDANWKIKRATVTIEAGVLGWHYIEPTAAEVPTAGEMIGQVKLIDSGAAVDYLEPVVIVVDDPYDKAP